MKFIPARLLLSFWSWLLQAQMDVNLFEFANILLILLAFTHFSFCDIYLKAMREWERKKNYDEI